MIRLKRAYDPTEERDGTRVLVERLWPRGLRKEDAHLDQWLKDVAPSDALRKWYGHEADRWPEFRRRYRSELRSAQSRRLLRELALRAKRRTVTLIYSARDVDRNSAVVLAGELQGRKRKRAAIPGAHHPRAHV